jgi:hypothetical protein
MQIADLVLVPAPGEPDLDDPVLASEIKQFEVLLGSTGDRLRLVCCAANAADIEWIGHYVVTLAPAVLPVITAAAGAWLQARFGRKISLRIGDIEAQASSIKEVELLLAKARAFQADESAG